MFSSDDIANILENNPIGDDEVTQATQTAHELAEASRLPLPIDAVCTLLGGLEDRRDDYIKSAALRKKRKQRPAGAKANGRSRPVKMPDPPAFDSLIDGLFDLEKDPQDPRPKLLRRLMGRKTALAPFTIPLPEMVRQVWLGDGDPVWADVRTARYNVFPPLDLATVASIKEDRALEGISDAEDPDHLDQRDMQD